MMSLDEVATALARLFPDLYPVAPLTLLGSGFSSQVVETVGGIVFRIAKHEEAAQAHAKEARLLPLIRTRLPVAVPHPQWYRSATSDFPFGVIGYRRLPGEPLDPARLGAEAAEELAQVIAGFLLALHGLRLSLTLPGPADQARTLTERHKTIMPSLRVVLTPDEYQRIEQWWTAFLADRRIRTAPMGLCHGDFWYENLLVDLVSGALTGVLDFEHTANGDPAQDFMTLRYLGDEFVTAVLTAYQALGGRIDANCNYRMDRWWEARDFAEIAYAVRHEHVAELQASIDKLRHGPILREAR
jgi:aminoglycoside phosphotransferase (APT) family kinase protein